MKQGLKYAFGLTALFIVVANGSKSGQVFDSGARGVSTIWKTAQGR